MSYYHVVIASPGGIHIYVIIIFACKLSLNCMITIQSLIACMIPSNPGWHSYL